MIAIATDTNETTALVGTHFGKCRWLYLFDTERKEGVFIENPALEHESRVGCVAADFLAGRDVKMVVAGRFGSNVVDHFRKNNIQMVIPQAPKTISEIIRKIK